MSIRSGRSKTRCCRSRAVPSSSATTAGSSTGLPRTCSPSRATAAWNGSRATTRTTKPTARSVWAPRPSSPIVFVISLSPVSPLTGKETLMLDLGLGGKVAIITGGSEGLGRAAAERLAAEGARVAICARRPDVLERAAEGIRKAGGQVLALPVDVTKADQIEKFVGEVVGRWGGVDILVNNAGTSAAASFESVNDEGWVHDLELKLLAAIRLCRLAIP